MKFTRKENRPIALIDIASHNRQIYENKKNEFSLYFKLNLKQFLSEDIITLLTGFNIITFDKAIKTPDGISTKSWIKKQYGKKAQDLISYLIKCSGIPND